MSPTPERLKEVAFLNHMNVQQRVIVRKEDKDKFHSTKDFEGVRAGAQKQTTQEELIKTELTGAVPTSLQNSRFNYESKNNKLDAVVMEEPVGEAYVSQNEDLAFADVTFEKAQKILPLLFLKMRLF